MSSFTKVPRIEIADHCEPQSLEIDSGVRSLLERRFRCVEHIHWLEQQVQAELRWRSLQQRFERICGKTDFLAVRTALLTSSSRLLPAPSQVSQSE